MPIKTDIQLSYRQKIWNVFTAGKEYLLLELRDEATLSTFFDLYDLPQRKYMWRGLSLEEKWRIGVSYCNVECIVFHQYQTGTIPAIAALTGVDPISGIVKWKCENFQPVSYGEEYIEGIRNGQTMYLSIKTGVLLGEIVNYKESIRNNELVQPLTYLEESRNFELVRKFTEEYFRDFAKGSAAYCEYDGHIFVAYHVRMEKSSYLVKLTAMKNDGNVWLNEIIDEADGLLTDIFFIWNDYLLFFKGKNELNGINLKGK